MQTYGPNKALTSYILIITGLKLVQLLQVTLFVHSTCLFEVTYIYVLRP